MNSDYSEIYNHNMMENSDGKDNLNAHQIKFGDALAAISYAHDIEYSDIENNWPVPILQTQKC